MSFYTALTGLNGSQADISATSNNIANVGTTGFKRSRAEFGDIFATSPLQNSSSSIGSGTILKGIKQQFTQGNIVSSLNALDLAISGQGFFALKPSLTSNQTVYTRNGSLNVNNDRYVVDSAGQYLSVYPVNDDGSVTAKDLLSAVPLQLPVTSGDPRATGNIELGVNVPAAAAVVTEQAQFADGYEFNPDDPATFTNSTSITIFDDLGNPTIATIYFVKTQNASAADPTNKFDTRLVINDTVITPDLVNAVDDSGSQIFIDRFGTQTTTVPDDNYFLEGKGSPLYKADSLQSKVASQPASLKGEQTAFDFGEEGDKLVEIVTDPMQFNSTKEAGNADGNVFWGKDFLLVNIDDGDQPVSIDIRPGKYNAVQLANEVERAINEAYGDDKKIQIVQNVDDTLTIDLIKLDADGVSTGLTNKIAVDLLVDSFVSEQIPGMDINGASPDFTLEQFLAHSQARLNEALNSHVIATNAGTGAETSQNSEVGVASKLFARTAGTAMTGILDETQIVEFEYRKMDATSTAIETQDKFLVHSYYGNRPELSVYNERIQTNTNASGNSVEYDAAQNTLAIQLTAGGATNFVSGESIRLGGVFANASGESLLNGRELTIFSVDTTNHIIKVDTTGLSLPDTNFNETNTSVYALRDKATDVEAFFEGATNVYEGSDVNFNSKKIILREKGSTNLHSYTNSQLEDVSRQIIVTETVNGDSTAITTNAMADAGGESQVVGVGDTIQISFGHNDANYTFDIAGAGAVNVTVAGDTTTPFTTAIDNALAAINADANLTATRVGEKIQIVVANANATISNVQSTTTTEKGIFEVTGATLALTDASGAAIDALEKLGLETTTNADATTTKTVWVDELQPPIKIGYDEINQRLTFKVDRTVLGTGTNSNFNSFKVSGSTTAEQSNNLGIPAGDDAVETLIRGGEVLFTDPFVADGEELQLNDKRYGAEVEYNSDTKTFTFASGSTGEDIDANGAIGTTSLQKSSNIQVGRYSISATDGSVINNVVALASRSLGQGENALMGVGLTKTDAIFSAGTGLQALPAVSTGATAKEPLTQVFRLTNVGNENIFNVSVNGINGIIEIPTGNYVGSTLATALQERINQIRDPDTGNTVGGVTVKYDATSNNFTFTTGTRGDESTSKVKGAARLGLDDVALGVGSVPQIYNLTQATNAAGVALFVNENGQVVESPPANLVEGYFPLYIDEGELTFDKSGQLVSPKNLVHYEKQEEGFSIDLNIDFSKSTQFAQPFSVVSVDQDGFTSGRLDGLEIDASGTIRANYTNGQNNPLGKIVVANFNNQNGLKQIGNATYVETAVSGAPQVGEAGSEGFGNILSGSLERSNVDITEELVNLITAQRNFQASAKAIETTTTLTQTIINIRM